MLMGYTAAHPVWAEIVARVIVLSHLRWRACTRVSFCLRVIEYVCLLTVKCYCRYTSRLVLLLYAKLTQHPFAASRADTGVKPVLH